MGKNDLWKEYDSFCNLENHRSPVPELAKKIVTKIENQIKFSFYSLELKILGFYLFFCSLSLVFCPQLGVSSFIFASQNSLMELLKINHTLCAIGCGAVFMGIPSLIIGMILKENEVKIFNSFQFLFILFHSILAILTLKFLNFGNPHYDFQFILLWLLGAIVCSQLFTSLVFLIRSKNYTSIG